MRKTLKTLTVSMLMSLMLFGSAPAAAQHAATLQLATSLLGKSAKEIADNEKKGRTLGEQLSDAGKLEAFKQGLRKQARSVAKRLVTDEAFAPDIANDLLVDVESHLTVWEQAPETAAASPFGGRLDRIAELLNLTESEVLTALKTRSLGALLSEQGKLEAYKETLLQDTQAQFARRVEDGEMQAEAAASIYGNLQNRLRDWDGMAA